MVANEILRFVIRYTQPGSGECQNVFHYVLEGNTQTDEDIFDVMLAWLTLDWAPGWEEVAANVATIIGCTADIVGTDGLTIRAVGAQPLDIDGTVGDQSMPAAVAALLTASTDDPRARGRKFVPGVSEGQIDNGLFAAGATALFTVLLEAYIDSLTAGSGSALVPGVLSLTDAAFKAFNGGGTTTLIPAYQRRRKPGVGS